MVLVESSGGSDIEGLVNILFSPNAPAVVNICMPQMRCARELFFFCFNLFLCGVLRLHGRGQESIAVHTLTEAQFMAVARCMNNAGIDCDLLVEHGVGAGGPPEASMNLADIAAMPPDLPLQDYKLVARSGLARYVLTFKLFHRTPVPVCHSLCMAR